MRRDALSVGDVVVQRVVEWVGDIGTVSGLFPRTPHEVWEAAEDWLAPTFWTPRTDGYRCAVQTWVLRVGDRVILVDTGVGNGRRRPQAPLFDGLDTPFLERLRDAGVDPDDVDAVVTTHIHSDHVGWNTRREGESWVPTFPRATYYVPEADLDLFHPDRGEPMRAPRTEDERRRFDGIRLVFEDSIDPVLAAGLVRAWTGSLEIADGVVLRSAPGHTPGSAVVEVASADRSALLVGDLIHSPIQLSRLDDPCAFDLDPEAAIVARRRMLDQAARDDSWLIPAHFPGPGALRIRRAEEVFGVREWAPLPPV